jgi:hypothetical protein
LIGCHDIPSEIQENITIQISIDNSHLVNLVFNMNVQQVKKRGRKQGDERKQDNKGGQNKQQKVIITCT